MVWCFGTSPRPASTGYQATSIRFWPVPSGWLSSTRTLDAPMMQSRSWIAWSASATTWVSSARSMTWPGSARWATPRRRSRTSRSFARLTRSTSRCTPPADPLLCRHECVRSFEQAQGCRSRIQRARLKCVSEQVRRGDRASASVKAGVPVAAPSRRPRVGEPKALRRGCRVSFSDRLRERNEVRVEGSGVVRRVAHARGVDVEDAGDLARHVKVDKQLAEMEVAVDCDGRELEVSALDALGRDCFPNLGNPGGVAREPLGEPVDVPVEPIEQRRSRSVDRGHHLEKRTQEFDLIEKRGVIADSCYRVLRLDARQTGHCDNAVTRPPEQARDG